DVWVVKMDAAGNIEWQKCLGGTGDDQAQAIQQTNDGGYIVAGVTSSNDGDVTGNHTWTNSGGTYNSRDCWIVKLNNIGEIEWQKCLGGKNGDSANAVQQTNDGGYIVAGESASDDGDVLGNYT